MSDQERQVITPDVVQLPPVASQSEAYAQYIHYQQTGRVPGFPAPLGSRPTAQEQAQAARRIAELKAAGKWWPAEDEEHD